MSSLSIERLSTLTLPFLYNGVDYFGPILIKFKIYTRAVSENAEQYVALLSCMPIRAIHLEFY